MTTVTVGTGSSLPSEANELSKVIMFAAQKIRYLQPAKQYVISDNPTVEPVFLIDIRTFPTLNYGWRASILVILKLIDNWASSTGKIWEKVQAIPIDSFSPEGQTDTFTPGTGGSIPSTVTNYARLIAWGAEALNRVSPGTLILENSTTGFVLPSDYRTGYVSESGNLMSCRFSIPLEPNFGSLDQALYKSCRAVNNVALPSDVLS